MEKCLGSDLFQQTSPKKHPSLQNQVRNEAKALLTAVSHETMRPSDAPPPAMSLRNLQVSPAASLRWPPGLRLGKGVLWLLQLDSGTLKSINHLRNVKLFPLLFLNMQVNKYVPQKHIRTPTLVNQHPPRALSVTLMYSTSKKQPLGGSMKRKSLLILTPSWPRFKASSTWLFGLLSGGLEENLSGLVLTSGEFIKVAECWKSLSSNIKTWWEVFADSWTAALASGDSCICTGLTTGAPAGCEAGTCTIHLEKALLFEGKCCLDAEA